MPAEHGDQLHAFDRLQSFDDIREIGRMNVLQKLVQALGIRRGQQVLYGVYELGIERSRFVVNIG